jgi:hypothetical protein
MKAALFALCLCLLPGVALARPSVTMSPSRPLTIDCVVEAARVNDVPLAALLGILAVENGQVGQAVRNANGTFDLGPFQVNTCNLSALAEFGFRPEDVLRDGCVNAHAAARLLRRELDRTGTIWGAVGAYHSRTPAKRNSYIGRVKERLLRMSGQGQL